MKRTLMSLIALGLLMVASAHAQSSMKVTVPFDFVVNGHNMSAGEYDVQTLGTAGNAVAIYGADKALALTMACSATQPANASKLIFHRYGGEYFLAQIWTAGNTSGRQLPRSAAEREIAATDRTADLVTVAALR